MAGAKDGKDELAPPAPPELTGDDKPPEGYTDEEWQGLSKAEREGIRDSVENPETDDLEEEIDEKALEAIAKEGGERPPEKPPAEPAKPPEPAVPPIAPPVAEAVKPPEEPPKPPEVPPATTIPTDEELLRFRAVVPDSELPAVDAVPAEIQAKLEALDDKYEAGDIDLKGYNKERDALNRQVVMSNVTAQNEVRNQKAWEKEQQFFFTARPEYMEKDGGGKFTLKASAMFGAFKESINRLGEDPRYSGAPGMELLLAADRAVKEAFGVAAKPVAPLAKPSATDPNAPPKDGGKPPAPPPGNKTLADVPAAGGNQTEDWRSALDKLSGSAYEAALERMTEEQRAMYLDGR